ncbi:RNA-directed DNA polymerase from mobile element jockey, partial [Trichonephila clavipes]
STRQQERTTQLASRNETTQLGSRNKTTQLCIRNETTQLCTAVDRLQPPAPPLQQNRLFLPTIDFPPTPTRFGHNSANTIDIALIKNFYYPFTINSIDDLSSDHNPVFLNFSFKLAMEPPNPRAVSTDWNAFKNNLNKKSYSL